jgi:hypothetical protein
VTCFVGKNESGKSAFLNALWRVKPARSKPAFVIHDHYPAWLEKRHRLEGVDQEEFEPVEVCLEWEPADVKAMEDRFGPSVVAAGDKLRLWKKYSNEFRWESGCNEQQAVKNFVGTNPVPAAEQATYAALADFDALKARLAADEAKRSPNTSPITSRDAWRSTHESRRKWRLEEDSCGPVIGSRCHPGSRKRRDRAGLRQAALTQADRGRQGPDR